MKIAIAALSGPAHMNGVSRHATSLVTALLHNSEINEVHFIAGDWQKEMFRRTCERSDPRLHKHFVSLTDTRISRLFWYYWELPHIARQLEADLVHFVCPSPIRAGAFRCSTVLTVHDLYPFDIPQNFGRMSSPITRRIMSGAIRNADAIACVSESTRSRLEAWFPAEARKAVTICNVVEPDRSVRVEPLPLIPDGQAFLLCIAQHRSNKNIPLAIQVFDHILRKRVLSCNAQLLIVGIPGPETAMIQRLIKELRLEDNVRLLTGVSDGQLQWCYRNCKLLLAPSLVEGFGLPVAEALLAGCPVVCSDIPAFREVGGDMCHYVSGGEDLIGRYGAAIRQVLAMARPAPALLPHLSSRLIGREYVELYQRLACCAVSEFWYATANRT